MRNKLSKKTKIFLSVASAIITNTAITTLLTSCSLSNKINDTGGFDKEYGINNATYTRMEEDFEMLYKSQLDQRKESGDIDDDAYDSNLYAFQNNLNSIHTSLYSGENKTLSYTIKTNVLRDYARDNYGIRLSRQSSVILNEAIEDIRSSIVNSVLLMCKEYGITDTSEYRKNSEVEFDKLEDEAKTKYGDADVVSIVQYIQSGMTTCFNGICEELDCLATQQQLKKFIEKYSISVKEDVADDYCWDKLFIKYGDGNKEISVEDFNNIFEISCEDSDPQKVYGSYLLTSRKTEKFSNNLIPGYTLKPILVKMNGDPYTNTYSINVDYTLVKTDYIENENVAEFTSHSSALKNKSFYEDEKTSIFDLNASDEEREYTNYVLPITKEYEEQQINATYFNNENFKFSWSTSNEYGYDDFWTEAVANSKYKGKLDVSNLATTGMMINGYLLSELLKGDNSDEKPIEYQNAIKLIQNANFSLDFTEKDYDADIDGKKGEIQVDNFNIGYKNSKNTFKALNSFNQAISNAINNDSGITKRFSNNLWKNIKTNYDSASKTIDIQDLLKTVEEQQSLNNVFLTKEIVIYVLLGITAIWNIMAIVRAFTHNQHSGDKKVSIVCCIILVIIIGIYIPLVSVPSHQIFSSVDDYYKDIKDFDNQGTNQSFAFVKHINNDRKYFYNSKGEEDKAEFDKLPLADVRNLKIYYSNPDTNDEYNTYTIERNKIGVWTKDDFVKEKVNSYLGKSPLAWWQLVISVLLFLILFVAILPTLVYITCNIDFCLFDAADWFFHYILCHNREWFFNCIHGG